MDYYERIELIELSEEPKAKITIEEICEELLIEAGKQRNWTGALRSLLVIHKMIHKLGSKGRHPISFANAKEINHFSTLKATDNSPGIFQFSLKRA